VRDLDAAERYAALGLDLLDEADHLGRARSLGLLGVVHYERFKESLRAGQPAAELRAHLTAALRAYLQSLDLFPATAVSERAGAHHHLGVLYGEGGEFDAAVRHFQEAVRYDEQQGDRHGAGVSRQHVADALLQLGRFGDALLWAQAALRDFQAYGDRAAGQIAQVQQLIAEIEQARTGGSA
jgi:tetratricopeptide (TPR) repeat protein